MLQITETTTLFYCSLLNLYISSGVVGRRHGGLHRCLAAML